MSKLYGITSKLHGTNPKQLALMFDHIIHPLPASQSDLRSEGNIATSDLFDISDTLDERIKSQPYLEMVAGLERAFFDQFSEKEQSELLVREGFVRHGPKTYSTVNIDYIVSIISLFYFQSQIPTHEFVPLCDPRWNEISIGYRDFTNFLLEKIVPNNEWLKPYLASKESYNVENKKARIIEFVTNRLPCPDETVTMEQIRDYRADPQSMHNFKAIKTWINKMSNSPYSLSEISDEYDYLLSQYENSYRLHKMKYHNTTFQAFFVCSVDVVESLLKLNWSQAVKKLFDVRKSDIEIRQDLTTLPGKEVAYVFHAHKNYD